MARDKAEREAEVREDIAIAIAKGDINALTAAAGRAADLDDEPAAGKAAEKDNGLER